MLRPTLLFSLLLAFSFGCGPPAQSDSAQGSTDSGSTAPPELTDEVIREVINDANIWEVPNENGTGEPIYWNFDEDEPKEIVVVEKNVEGTRGTIVLDIKTGSSARSRNKVYLAGQIRTEWELRTGWVLRKWEIVQTENISMKYRDLPKNPEQKKQTRRSSQPRILTARPYQRFASNGAHPLETS